MKSRSVPGSRSAVVRAQVVWATKIEQNPSPCGASLRCVSITSVISTIWSFLFVEIEIVVIKYKTLSTLTIFTGFKILYRSTLLFHP